MIWRFSWRLTASRPVTITVIGTFLPLCVKSTLSLNKHKCLKLLTYTIEMAEAFKHETCRHFSSEYYFDAILWEGKKRWKWVYVQRMLKSSIQFIILCLRLSDYNYYVEEQ
jgi:hypothetical protein